MHPPLDRPHPDCQEEIDALRTCQMTNSKLKFWACNEAKFAMDRCLKAEKQRLLTDMNRGFDERRQREEDAYRDAMGQELTFDEYLQKDPEFRKAAKEAEERNKKFPDMYKRRQASPSS